jgi:phosphoribosylformylglycinamidine cyclo-ligase
MHDPVLVASTDGVGTKTKVAARLKRWDSIGKDIVNHCLNDILVQGAQPLFFLDYIATSALNPQQMATIVGGVAQACQEAGCALLGGETAEMPGVYTPGAVDLVGTVIGVVERAALLDGSAIRVGDIVIGLPSSGLHTNGYTLARHVLEGMDWDEELDFLDGRSIGDALLEPHRSYLGQVRKLWAAGITLHGLVHITGGGLVDNPPRVFPQGIGAVIRRETWTEPPIFTLIQQRGQIPYAEMFHVFNMGLGMLVIVPPDALAEALEVLDEPAIIGEVAREISGVLIE